MKFKSVGLDRLRERMWCFLIFLCFVSVILSRVFMFMMFAL